MTFGFDDCLQYATIPHAYFENRVCGVKKFNFRSEGNGLFVDHAMRDLPVILFTSGSDQARKGRLVDA